MNAFEKAATVAAIFQFYICIFLFPCTPIRSLSLEIYIILIFLPFTLEHISMYNIHTQHTIYIIVHGIHSMILFYFFFTLLVVVPWVEFNVNEHDLICSGNDNLFFLLWNIFKWFQIFRIVCFHIKFNILFLIPSISSTLSQSYFYLMHIFLRLFPTNYIILNCKWRFYFNDGGDDIWIYDLKPYRINLLNLLFNNFCVCL